VTPVIAGPVVCVGETMVALVPDPGQPLTDAESLRIEVAGAESNVAMYLADHGVAARWVSAVGDDPFGERIVAEVAACGVDVRGLRTDSRRPTGLMVKSPGEDGTRVHYYRRGSAASALGPALLADEAVRTAGLLHLTGVTAALSDSCRDLVDAALRGTRPVSFDVNHRPALWPDDPAPPVPPHGLADPPNGTRAPWPDGSAAAVPPHGLADPLNRTRAPWPDDPAPPVPPRKPADPPTRSRTPWPDGSAAAVLHGFADRADITFVGLDEAQALWGADLADAAAVRALLPGPRVLVVKDGARGATAFVGPVAHTVPARPVDVVEPVGAGDAFAAGFLTGLLRGEPPVRALRLGHLTAGAALRVGGDHGPLPDRARIERLLDATEDGWASAVADGDLPVH
jgi:2-dehydro-3-deoxygluconokinase